MPPTPWHTFWNAFSLGDIRKINLYVRDATEVIEEEPLEFFWTQHRAEPLATGPEGTRRHCALCATGSDN